MQDYRDSRRCWLYSCNNLTTQLDGTYIGTGEECDWWKITKCLPPHQILYTVQCFMATAMVSREKNNMNFCRSPRRIHHSYHYFPFLKLMPHLECFQSSIQSEGENLSLNVFPHLCFLRKFFVVNPYNMSHPHIFFFKSVSYIFMFSSLLLNKTLYYL